MYIRTKAQFDALTTENKEAVLFFLNDSTTENNVQIKLHDDGLITFRDYSETEFNEVPFKQDYIDKDVLLYILGE